MHMVSIPDLSKIQKHKYKETLYMVCNLDLRKTQKSKYKKSFVHMVSNQDLSKIQKYKYKHSLCMVFNLDLSKFHKHKYKESLCIWYPFQTWSKYRHEKYKNLSGYGIQSGLEQNTETQIQRIFVHVVSSGPAPGDSSKSGLFAEESPQSSASFSSYSPEGLFSELLLEGNIWKFLSKQRLDN